MPKPNYQFEKRQRELEKKKKKEEKALRKAQGGHDSAADQHDEDPSADAPADTDQPDENSPAA